MMENWLGPWMITGHCPKCDSPIFSKLQDGDTNTPVPITIRSCQCINISYPAEEKFVGSKTLYKDPFVPKSAATDPHNKGCID